MRPSDDDPPVSRATVAGYTLLGLLLVGWFLRGLFIERQGLVDSAGESLGSAFAALLLLSIIGVIRQGD